MRIYLLFTLLFIAINVIGQQTWYSYQSGNWNDTASWTLDGSANPDFINPAPGQVPAATDNVVITSGRTITIQPTTNNLTVANIEIIDKLDVTTSTGHNFTNIEGSGKIIMSGSTDNFPAGTTTDFIDPINGGTVEIQGTGTSLDQNRTFNNLIIDLTSGSVTLLNDLTLNGDLTVTNGDFKINDNSATTVLDLTVNGDVLVESTGTISTGTGDATDGTADNGYGNYHKYYHVFTVNGNFTNQGSVRLTNQTAPDYDSRTNTGAVSLVFSSAENKTFSCQGITDLYYLVIDKGTDQTYSLTINATDKSYFSLFGENDSNWDDDDEENPENRKALWIKAGSLILEGYVYIPTLSEGSRDWTIGANAALILNSANVFVSSTTISNTRSPHRTIDYTGLSYSTASGFDNGNGSQGIYVNGTLKINDGTFETNYSHGIVYREESTANKLEINGGTVTAGQFRISGSTNAASAKMSYLQTGGELVLVDNRTNAAIFDLSAGLGTFTMSGGTITLNDLSGGTINAIEIGCDVSNINVTGGTVIIDNSTGTSASANISSTAPLHNLILRENQGNGIDLYADLSINNDLTIEAEDFDAKGYDVTIGSDLSITSGATYTTGTNTTTFDGDKKSNLYIPLLQTFNNLTIAKSVDDKNFIIGSAPTVAIQVDGEFRVERGTFDYGSHTINLNDDLYVADSIGTSSSTGKIVFTGSAQQFITSDDGAIQNMEINNTYASGSNIDLEGDINIFGTLSLSDGVFDINTHRLTMYGANASIAGTFGTGEMIQTNGSASDGGLGLYIDANGTYTFPIGTDDNSDTRYTPVEAIYSSYFDDGYVFISVADNVLPTTNGNGNPTVLSYYWDVDYSDFTTVPNVTEYTFHNNVNDEDGANTGSWKCGKVLDVDPWTRGTDNSYDGTNYEIVFDNGGTPFALEDASYTAGANTRFTGTLDVFNSLKTGYFDTKSTWVENKVPTEGSIVVIHDSHNVKVDAAFDALGAVIFDQPLATPGSEELGRLQFEIDENYDLGVVSGVGMISYDGDITVGVTADVGDFAESTYSFINYTRAVGVTLTNILEPTPSLRFAVTDYSVDQELDINGDLVIQGNGTMQPLKNVDIAGNLIVGNWIGGNLVFPEDASAITVTVEGNVDFTYDNGNASNPTSVRTISAEDVAATVDHKLIVKGDIIQGSYVNANMDLYNSSGNQNVILELQGESDNTYSRTSTTEPDFYRVIVNKGSDQTNSFTFNESFTLSGATNTASNKALELQNGRLILNDADIDIDLTTGEEFSIPATSILEVTAGTVNASGTDGGITLDGTIRINGGTVDMTGGASEKNFIEYGASGNAQIDISSGSLIVGSQIRRLTSSSNGVLKYSQTGGDVTIGVNSNDAAYEENRGVLEILNTGSDFTFTGGSLTIQRQNGGTPSVGAIYLDPTTSDVSGSNITIGNSNTPEAQNSIGINSSISLDTLTIFAEATLTDKPDVNLSVRALTITGDLVTNANSTFDANGLDLTIQGNFINDGTYTANGNTLIFDTETSQSLSGSGTEDIYNFTKTGTGTFSLSKSSTINNALNIESGTLATTTYALDVKGHVTLDGTITSTSGNGIVFSGTAEQNLVRSGIGSSYIGTMTVNNANGVTVTNDNYSFIISDNLRLQSGVFDIGGSLLELEESATITPVSAFSVSNMIQTNSSFTDNGVKKNFSDIASSTELTFPIGQAKYTPVVFTITNSDAGSLRVRPANEMHLTVTEDDEAPNTEIVDADNCLQYHWIISAEDITSLSGSAAFTYDASDLEVTAPYSSINYIPARLFANGTTWDKAFGTDDFDEGANTFTVNYTSVDNDNISGDYTAGVGVDNSDVAINGAIPDDVPTYETTGTGGNYDSGGSWTTSIPSGGPVGAIVTVKSGTTLTLNNNNVRIYKTVIESGAILEINETTQHRLGTVTGNGDIKIVSSTINANLPAGYYTDFFNCTGGGIVYAGSGDYNIMSNINQVRNLTLSGTGTNELSSDITVCENFIIDNGATLDNTNNKDIDVQGDLTLSNGTFNSGTSNTINVDGTFTVSGGTYNGETSGTDSFGALNISSGSFNTGSGGTITLLGNLSFSGGSFSGGSGTSSIELAGSSAQSITGTFTGVAQFHNLVVNNSSGITLAGDLTINNSLTLTAGRVTPGANTLLLNSAATITPSIGTSSSYINGKLSKVLASVGDDFDFPVGKSGRWGYAGIYNVTTAGLTWDVEYFATDATNEALVDNLTPTSALIKSVTPAEYWKISDNGSSNAEIKLSWNSNSGVSDQSSEREKLEVMVWDDGTTSWDKYGGGSFSSGHTQSSGSFYSTSAIAFSENIITLGTSDENNPLPIELIFFSAKPKTNTVELTWATATELNNDYFEIERSVDGIIFEVIGYVDGTGNSSTRIDYSKTDYNPIYGNSYYRIKQVDFDGQYSYTPTESVLWNGNGDVSTSNIKVYPNPYINGELVLETKNIKPGVGLNIAIYGLNGKQIYKASLVNPEDQEINLIPMMLESIAKGMYIININTKNKISRAKLIVE